jgi:uncharacterized membrane protein YphA (DoxX/SURF4 family)
MDGIEESLPQHSDGAAAARFSRRPTGLRSIGRLAEILLALVFLASAAAKLYEPFGFRVQLAHYGIPKASPLISVLVLAVPLIELILAGLLISGLTFRKATLVFTAGMLVAFSVAIGWGWAFHGLEDCGCFGDFLKLPPGLSLLRNGLLIALAGVSYVARSAGAIPGVWDEVRFIARHPSPLIIALLLTLGAGGGAFALRSRQTAVETPPAGLAISHGPDDPDEHRPFAAFRFQTSEGSVDLGQGSYLVALLSMSCDHCADAVPELNDLPRFFPGFPQIVALCLGDESSRADFEDRTQPDFPLFLLEPLAFFDLIGQSPPRFVLIEDGRIIRFWDADLPSDEAWLEVLESLGRERGERRS